MKRYYLMTITVNFGQSVAYQSHAFAIKGSPDRYTARYCKSFFSDCEMEDAKGYWFFDECVVVSGSYREVPKEEYLVLKKYL